MPDEFRQILGVRFFVGSLDGLLERTAAGGLVPVPSAPVLVQLTSDPAHREALEHCDFAVTDSGFMVLLWALFRRERIPRISGLRFLRALLGRPEVRAAGATFWVMPTAEDAEGNSAWLRSQGIAVGAEDCYVAPRYPSGGALADAELLARVEARKPRFVILCVGGGVQERLGYFLRRNLSGRPAILCTGAAIAFLSGRQIGIPAWADRLFLGWFLRILSHPRTFPPRIWKALRLAPLIRRYGSESVAAGSGRDGPPARPPPRPQAPAAPHPSPGGRRPP